MYDDPDNVDGDKNKIGSIYGVDNSGLETIGHSECGHKIFCLVTLDRKKIRNNTCECDEIKEVLHPFGNLRKQADQKLYGNHIQYRPEDCERTPEISLFHICLNKEHTKTKAPNRTCKST